MSNDTPTVPASFDSATLIDGYDLSFDPGDKLNGSLYVCTVRGSGDAEAANVVATLRAAGLWSGEAVKTVADEQRQAYRDGLVFVEARAYGAGKTHVVLARFDHPKFPSDAGRWQAWTACMESGHERLR